MDITHSLSHRTKEKANGTYKWIPSDTEEAFELKLKSQPNNLNVKHYQHNPIEYKLNNMGFRTDVDFVEGITGNLFLGCSHTFGIGHYLENIWSWKLNEHIGGNFLNLGVGGSGIGTGSRLLYGLRNVIKPQNVFLFYPHPNRFEYFDTYNKNWYTHYSHNTKVSPIITEKNNVEMYYYLHFNLIKSLCRELKCNLFTLDKISPSNAEGRKGFLLTEARDVHLDVHLQHYIYTEFKKVYENKVEPTSRIIYFEESWNEPKTVTNEIKKLY